MYDFLTGPMFWFSIATCFVGLLVRVAFYVKGLNWQLDRVAYRAYPYAGFKGALRSIFRWLLPFGTHSWRKQPFVTVTFFLFHAGVVLVPVFLLAHNVFLESKIGFSLATLPQGLADVLAVLAVASGLLLLLRRIGLPQVRILTDFQDYFLLLISLLPLVTGLMARFELGSYSFWLQFHILSGEVLLILVPFTKLSHIVLFFASRAQLGMDYAIKRGGLKGGHVAW